MSKKKANIGILADFISGDSASRWSSQSTDMLRSSDWGKFAQSRILVFWAAAILVLLIFAARLFTLTVVQGAQNRQLAEQNRVRLVEVEAPRGEILARGGQILAKSETIYILKKNGQVTPLNGQQVQELIRQGLASEDFEGEMGRIERRVERVYPMGASAAHILGYTSTSTPAASSGKVGVEQQYNDFLTGVAGKKLIEVDAREKKVSILGQKLPAGGRNIHLTIDADLQKFAFEVLKAAAEKVGTKRGAVIISEPSSGAILAIASYPSYDPADIASSIEDANKPFFNRAISGVYPPGSVFKIVTALSGLESGKINKDTEIEDVGEFEVGGSKFANWFFLKYGKTDGILRLQKAIARSNDIFFYRVAEKVGLEELRKMALAFGFGQKTGIDSPSEAVGLVPDEVWKKSTYGQDWFLGDTMHLGIGQGFILATPIQINMMTNYMAVGKLLTPYVVSKIDGGANDTVNLSGKVLAQNLVSAANFDLVRAGMRDACKLGGTGAPFFSAAYDVGCKTGTAEKALGDPHAWFTAFAPFDSPKISLTVLVEDGGEGSAVAAPVARQIVDWWMANRAEQ